MRIAIFADSLPPSSDGVARTYTRVAEYFEQNQIDYLFFSPFKPGVNFAGYKKVVHLPSIPLIFYTHYRIALPEKTFLFKKLDDFSPDIIHVSSPTPVALLAHEYAISRNLPNVASFHTDFIAYFKYYGFEIAKELGWAYLRWFYNKFDKILIPSGSTRKLLQEKSFKNLEIWSRGIDHKVYFPIQRKNGQKIKLLFVGRLVKEKDLLDLIDVCRILDNRRIEYQITFAGDGELHQTLGEKISHSKITGFIQEAALSDLYRESDIFVFPSTTETFGNVILEALASGLPVLVTEKGAAKDLITHGKTGFISKAHDTKEFADYCQILINNEKLRRSFSEQAYQSSLEYSWEKIHTGLLNVYTSLVFQKRVDSRAANLATTKVA